jgi:hypothetical protein
MGAAYIYGELREQGADAYDVNARLTPRAGSIPYAALELLPEFRAVKILQKSTLSWPLE